MATDAAEFLITLNQQVSGPAAVAAGALQQVERAAKSTTDAVTKVSEATTRSHAPMSGATSKANEAATATLKLQEAAKGMAEQASATGGAVGKLQELLGALGPQGRAAAVAIGLATVAITAFVGAIAGGMALAIQMTETLGRMRLAFDALAGGAAAGGKVSAMVDRLGQSLPFATAQVGEWAKGLLAAGVKGQRLENEIKAIAAAQAVLGAGAGGAAESLFKKLAEGGPEADAFMKLIQKGGKLADHRLKEMGLSIDELGGKAKVAKMTSQQLTDLIANKLQAKGAKALAAQMNEWPNILQKAKEGFSSIFAGMKGPAEEFMSKVAKLFGLFNKGGFAIQILKPIATSVFGTLFSWATKALGWAYDGFIRLAIVGVKAYIMAHPLVATFRQLWSAVVLLGTALGIVGGKSSNLGVLAFVGKVIGATFQGLITIIRGVVGAITWVVTTAAKVISMIRGAFSGMGAAGAGAGGNLVAGLVQGILGGIGRVVGAVGSLASSALGAFRSAFQMHSPSRLLIREGDENMAGAVAGGVKRGTPKVARAMAGLKTTLGGGGGKQGRDGGGGGDTYNFDFTGAHIGGGVDIGEFKRMLVRALQEARREVSEMEPAPT